MLKSTKRQTGGYFKCSKKKDLHSWSLADKPLKKIIHLANIYTSYIYTHTHIPVIVHFCMFSKILRWSIQVHCVRVSTSILIYVYTLRVYLLLTVIPLSQMHLNAHQNKNSKYFPPHTTAPRRRVCGLCSIYFQLLSLLLTLTKSWRISYKHLSTPVS